jgi:hypothetical protein
MKIGILKDTVNTPFDHGTTVNHGTFVNHGTNHRQCGTDWTDIIIIFFELLMFIANVVWTLKKKMRKRAIPNSIENQNIDMTKI